MKSYQHSNKSESLKGVAGLNCESRFFVFFLSRFRQPSFIFLPPLLPLRWMDGCIENVCMHSYVRYYTRSTSFSLGRCCCCIAYSQTREHFLKKSCLTLSYISRPPPVAYMNDGLLYFHDHDRFYTMALNETRFFSFFFSFLLAFSDFIFFFFFQGTFLFFLNILFQCVCVCVAAVTH